MSRSYKAPWAIDHTKGMKQQASQTHRAGENKRLRQELGWYQPLPSKHYINPYDISDFRFQLTRDMNAHFVKGKNKINK